MPKTPFMEAVRTTDPFPESDFDGILGLGFTGAAMPPGLQTPLDVLTEVYGNTMPSKAFSFKMSSSPNEPSELLIGTVPQDRYSKGINWLDVLEFEGPYRYTAWMVELDEVSFGNAQNQQSAARYGRVALVDSGTSCIVMAAPDARDFYNLARAAHTSDSRCSAMPTITLKLGGQAYSLTGEDYGKQRAGVCEICVQAGDSFWILGDVFHRKYNVTYDFGSVPPRVGIPVGQSGGRSFWQVALWFAVFLASLVVVLGLLWTARRRQLAAHRASARLAWPLAAPSAPTVSQMPEAAGGRGEPGVVLEAPQR